MIKNVIFDVGKVLVDYDPNSYMEELGLDAVEREAVNRAMFENPLWAFSDEGVYPAEEFLPRFIAEDREHEAAIRLAYEHLGGIITMYPYVIPWMKELKEKGISLYVLSNYPEFLYQMTEPRMEFLPYLNGAVFSAFEHDVKPRASIYELLMNRYQLNASECVFVDDRLENVQAAEKLGIMGIHFTEYEKAHALLQDYL